MDPWRLHLVPVGVRPVSAIQVFFRGQGVAFRSIHSSDTFGHLRVGARTSGRELPPKPGTCQMASIETMASHVVGYRASASLH